MPSLLARCFLFLSSYFPLAAIFFLIYWEREQLMACVILAIATLGTAGMILYVRLAERIASRLIDVKEIGRRDGESMGYIVTYMVPFLAASSDSAGERIALLIFFMMLAVLYVNSNMIHLNPTLNLLGYHLYEIKLGDRLTCSLIARARSVRGDKLDLVQVGEDIYLEKPR